MPQPNFVGKHPNYGFSHRKILCRDLDSKALDRACQKIAMRLWTHWEKTASVSSRNIQSNFYHLILLDHQEFIKENPNPIVEMFEESMRSRKGIQVIYEALSQDMVQYCFNCIQKEMENAGKIVQQEPTMSSAQSVDVNRFFGWAVSDIKRRLKAKDITEEGSENCQKLKMLNRMTVFEHEVLNDIEYLETYYPMQLRFLNRGGLTLVSKPFAILGTKILEVTSIHMDMSKISSLQSEVVKEARKEVTKKALELLPTFLQMTEGFGPDEDTRTRLFKQMTTKTFNARAGLAIKFYKEQKLGRGTEGGIKVAFRPKLAVECGKDKENMTKNPRTDNDM